MKKALLLSTLVLAACSKVPAGNVGVKAYLLGGEKGVSTEELSPGRYWIGPNEELYLFPTFTQNYTWIKANNEELSFQTREGMVVTADVGISYSILPTKVDTIYQKYRRGVEEITDLYLRNMVRDALVNAAAKMPIESVYGEGKTELMKQVQLDVTSQVKDLGINIEKVYWIGQLSLPPVVVEAINSKIRATQMAQQRQNEIAQAKAEADKKIEEARGVAESALAIAKAEAQAITIKGEALKNNPQLLELSSIEKWNGALPQVNSGAIPFIQLK